MIKLKPQIYLKQTANGPMLIDEHQYTLEAPERAELLHRLLAGVEPDSLTDDEFEQVERLNDANHLSIIDDPDAPAWELCGVGYSTLQNQVKHVSMSVIDLTENQVGLDVSSRLSSAGFKVVADGTQRLNLVFADSYHKLPKRLEHPAPILPIVCNRMKLFMGPLGFDWSESIVDKVLKNEVYMVEPRYKLPLVYESLQRAWITAALAQMIARSQLRYVGGLYEYDMTRMHARILPLE